MNASPAIIDVGLVDGPVEREPFDPFPPPAGAECVFYGRTRVEHDPERGRLERLSYEAYAPMAEQVIRELAAETARRFDCLAVRVRHATGVVPPGAASVVVQTVCGHRGPAFESCRHLMDALKARAPIWKREHFGGGASWSAGAPVPEPGA
ncbi:MAG: molybdopterin synthase catalytic subunit [Planctomycetota bacterium]